MFVEGSVTLPRNNNIVFSTILLSIVKIHTYDKLITDNRETMIHDHKQYTVFFGGGKPWSGRFLDKESVNGFCFIVHCIWTPKFQFTAAVGFVIWGHNFIHTLSNIKQFNNQNSNNCTDKGLVLFYVYCIPSINSYMVPQPAFTTTPTSNDNTTTHSCVCLCMSMIHNSIPVWWRY